jgi:hypothetical protein
MDNAPTISRNRLEGTPTMPGLNLPENEPSIQTHALEQTDIRMDSTTLTEFPGVEATSANTWFRLAKWAKETKRLAPWQRNLAYSLGGLAAQGQSPSLKQRLHGTTILDQATKLGFRVID